MKITAILPQQKNPHRYSIYIAGRYKFSLSETALLAQGLTAGQEMSDSELSKYLKLSLEDKSYAQALHYAAMRAHSQWELEQYLKRKKIDQDQANLILDKLHEFNFLDDQVFAQGWVDNRRLLKNISQRRIINELRQKHVSEEIIKKALGSDSENDKQALIKLIEKKRAVSKYSDKQKLIGYLSRQGFNYEDIKSALAND